MSAEFNDTVEHICSLKSLFNNIDDFEKRTVLNRFFDKHLESFVHRIEEVYYKKIVLKRGVKQLSNHQELEIQRTYNTLEAFLPFIVAYNIQKYDHDYNSIQVKDGIQDERQ